ncbi:MAG: TRAP transporter small permease [Terriglobales bacterium]
MVKVSRAFELALEIVAVVLLVALLAIVVAGVVFRILGNSLGWYDEVASVVLAWLTYFGAALAAQKRAHLGFAELVLKLRPSLRVTLFALSEIIVLAFFAVVALYGWKVLDAVGFDTLASLPWVSQRIVQAIIPIGGVLFLWAQILSMPSALAQVRAGIDPEKLARDEAIHHAHATKTAAAESQET